MVSKFINPYAFVNFKKRIERKSFADLEKEETYSGNFEYEIELKTPLIIPNTSSDEFNKDENVSNSYGIYSYENLENKKSQDNIYQPVIPGSEIRGCIRNVYEALTNSCYNFNKNNDLYFSERVNPKGAYKPGILMKVGDDGEWQLYDADKKTIKDLGIEDSDYRIKNFQLIMDYDNFEMFEKVVDIDTDEGPKDGYLTIGNEFGGKRKQAVSFFIKKGKPLLDIKKDDHNYKRLKAAIESFVDKDGYCTYKRYLDAIKDNKTITIYYRLVNGNYRFSPAQIGRILYNTSLNEKVGDLGYCDTDKLCPACLLFGNINGDKAISGRVRFSDALTSEYDYSKSKFIYLISGSPKYSNKYFYGKYNNGEDWDNMSSIAGRKFYWHHKPNLDEIKLKVNYNENNKLKSRYYYIDNNNFNNKFVGKVYFEDLTKEEVNMLYKAISLIDDKHCHKLGHGKPFGFGSCNFTITSLKCEELNLDDIKNNVSWTISETDRELDYILDFNALDSYVSQKIKVNYPYNEDYIKEEGFKWFVSNKKSNNPQTLKPLISGNNRVSPVLNGYETKNEKSKSHN